MAQKRTLADRRIYGRDRYGREVLVAAQGQPIPDGFEDKPPAPAEKPKPKRSAAKSDGDE